MTWQAAFFGAVLGGGVLLAWGGIRRLVDKSLPDAERRHGFWWLNAGLLLAAVSMIAFAQLGRS